MGIQHKLCTSPMSLFMHLFSIIIWLSMKKKKTLEISASMCAHMHKNNVFASSPHDVLLIFCFWVSFDIPVRVLQMLQNSRRATPE